MRTDATLREPGVRPRNSICRFCARAPSRGQHRVAGPCGAICADCIEVGLYLALRGRSRPPREYALERLARWDPRRCEFCDRTRQCGVLGSHRALARVICGATGAVICADCLNSHGELLNRAILG